MKPTPHPEKAQLKESLCGNLEESSEQAILEHLDDCNTCQRLLENLAADDQLWQKYERTLKSEYESIRSLGQSSRLLPLDSDHATNHPVSPGDYARAPIDFAVSFLEPSEREDAIGRLDEYEILSVIGFGGMGIVLKGFQDELNRPVAIKVLAPHLAHSPVARQRFLREAQATAAIVHPNVMPILSVNEKASLPFLVMPYVACHSLQQRLDSEGALPVLEILRIGMQVAQGLAAAHAQGLVHRDVKPANILLERGVDRTMLTDFGLARAIDDVTLTRSGIVAGTPQYMSPEQARGESVDGRSDLFSLGSVLYAMCVGVPPFQADTSYAILRKITDHTPREIRQVNSAIPPWLDRLTLRLLAKDPNARLESASEVADVLRQCLAHLQRPNAAELPPQIEPRGRRRPRTRMVIAAVILSGIVSAFGLLARQPWRTPEADSPSNTTSEPANKTVSTFDETEYFDDSTLAESQNLRSDLDELLSRIDQPW